MDRARHSSEHRRLCELLRHYRESAGLRQQEVADRLGVAQSFVSKYETGERRLDLVELRDVCAALGVKLVEVVATFDGQPMSGGR